MLLDDPLAAVDAHVGQHLFEKCIVPLVKANKCVVLVTNALQFIRDATNIIVLDSGSIIEQGTFSQLVSSGGVFSDMMSTHAEGMATADDARSRDINSDSNNNVNTNNNSSTSLSTTQSHDSNPKKNLDSSVQPTTPTKTKTIEQEKSSAPKGQLIANEDRMVFYHFLNLFLFNNNNNNNINN